MEQRIREFGREHFKKRLKSLEITQSIFFVRDI